MKITVEQESVKTYHFYSTTTPNEIPRIHVGSIAIRPTGDVTVCSGEYQLLNGNHWWGSRSDLTIEEFILTLHDPHYVWTKLFFGDYQELDENRTRRALLKEGRRRKKEKDDVGKWVETAASAYIWTEDELEFLDNDPQSLNEIPHGVEAWDFAIYRPRPEYNIFWQRMWKPLQRTLKKEGHGKKKA